MIDVENEGPLMRAAEVPLLAWLPKRRGGVPLKASTVHSWMTSGVRGICLEHICVGGARCTTVPALLRFFERLTRLGMSEAPVTAPEDSSEPERVAC